MEWKWLQKTGSRTRLRQTIFGHLYYHLWTFREYSHRCQYSILRFSGTHLSFKALAKDSVLQIWDGLR